MSKAYTKVVGLTGERSLNMIDKRLGDGGDI
jgi:hypothetical protein